MKICHGNDCQRNKKFIEAVFLLTRQPGSGWKAGFTEGVVWCNKKPCKTFVMCIGTTVTRGLVIAIANHTN
jgi:hypothetical protein